MAYEQHPCFLHGGGQEAHRQCVQKEIASAFGCKSQQQVQRVLFGGTDVLEGESFEDHGVDVGGVTRSLRSASARCLAP